ncbi:MAG: hypothetical protein NOF05_14905 [Candidatus Accumulibacter phosphatis]|nr:hypothetical protein [Candidatus Accumulibacter phosphatis]
MIVALAPVESIGPHPIEKIIVSRTAIQGVVAEAPRECVIASETIQFIVQVRVIQGVIDTIATVDNIMENTCHDLKPSQGIGLKKLPQELQKAEGNKLVS